MLRRNFLGLMAISPLATLLRPERAMKPHWGPELDAYLPFYPDMKELKPIVNFFHLKGQELHSKIHNVYIYSGNKHVKAHGCVTIRLDNNKFGEKVGIPLQPRLKTVYGDMWKCILATTVDRNIAINPETILDNHTRVEIPKFGREFWRNELNCKGHIKYVDFRNDACCNVYLWDNLTGIVVLDNRALVPVLVSKL